MATARKRPEYAIKLDPETRKRIRRDMRAMGAKGEDVAAAIGIRRGTLNAKLRERLPISGVQFDKLTKQLKWSEKDRNEAATRVLKHNGWPV